MPFSGRMAHPAAMPARSKTSGSVRLPLCSARLPCGSHGFLCSQWSWRAGISWPSLCRSTPEPNQLRAYLSVLMPYRITAGELGHLLPETAGSNHETLRSLALKAGQQLRDAAGVQSEWAITVTPIQHSSEVIIAVNVLWSRLARRRTPSDRSRIGRIPGGIVARGLVIAAICPHGSNALLAGVAGAFTGGGDISEGIARKGPPETDPETQTDRLPGLRYRRAAVSRPA